ncbi:MAG: hypothetical protein WDA65_06895 [Christensenellales bacterium]
MKRFIALLIIVAFIVSIVGITATYAASAKVTISGPSEVLAGKKYKFTVTISAHAFNFISKITCGGVFSGKIEGCDAASGSTNKKLKNTEVITVTVSNNAKPGDIGTISVEGNGCSVNDNYDIVDRFLINKTKKVVVVDKLTVIPKEVAEPTQWELAQDSIGQLQQGGTLNLNITESAKVPAAVLDDITKKQAVVNINFADYSCKIDGSNFSVPSGLKELDLSLKMEKNGSLSAAAGGADAYQLHFGHSGQLPGPVTFSIKAKDNSPGDTLYLYYYYDQSGEIEGKLSAVVDDDGYVEFTIFHCSSYFLSESIIEGALGGLAAIADIAEKDARILELESTITKLEERLETAQNKQPEPEPDDRQEQVFEPQDKDTAAGILDITIIEFGAIVLGALLLGIVGTVIVFRSGRKGRHAAVKASSDL